MYKNLKTPAVECLENGTYHCTGKYFLQNNIFKIHVEKKTLQASNVCFFQPAKI